ncbi:ras-associated and pleckstrin homology domains-containing protein 1 isoform X2 [Lepeophtheirus salmonis]|uniref:ras-associated and pleckstrin homology domains-containing protein 1 isoform X2 n=1 Tax=Lepeophtheirus salmonis TaxID=72036 RepID=UPI001AE60661|nr:ras-associated and pleckstrin homology domains-containing protein 1-like isoform X2 [Lepeophtheirus salmonis]
MMCSVAEGDTTFTMADELNRRRTFAQKPALREWAPKNNRAETVSKSTRTGEEGNNEHVNMTSNNSSTPDDDDPGRLLNVWLGELDSIQKGLDLSMSCSPHTPIRSSPHVQMRRMSTPRIESPRLDTDRYSLVNLEESLDQDLDNILGELCALESDLTKHNGNNSNNSNSSNNSHHHNRRSELLSEPAYITAESVRLNKLKAKGTPPQDDDSAFGDNASSSSGNTSSSATLGGIASISSSSSIMPKRQLSVAESPVPPTKGAQLDPKEEKAEKIRLAIEKMKEAAIKKIFIKVFSEDGSTKSLLVDERMTVAQVCAMLAEKNNVKRDPSWGLVELLPDLHMERAYEDSEYLVENLLLWKADSKNTLWFIKRPEVYDLFMRPETYLLGTSSSQCGAEMEDHSRIELLEEYFCSTGVGAPDVEGFLFLKAEGKKTWKKFYFVLRTSGLYYAPKGKKTSKDLICLATFDVNQVYFGVKWQPKFKAPTPHCFSIKHPQIQAKSPKYIRYLCAETEFELNRWVTGIRLAKYGKILNQNYRAIIEDLAHQDLDKLARYSSSNATAEKSPQSENRSFDSALCPSPPPPPLIIPESHNHSSSSEKSSVELGFSCDSPEGGTIKKKPNFSNFKNGEIPKPKNVRFKDTFSVKSDDEEDESYPIRLDKSLYANIEEILNQTNITHDKFTKNNLVTTALNRLSSSDNISSNPMLHTGSILSNSSSASKQSTNNISHQPKRPAPVLSSQTPSLVRKPSLDRFYLQKRDGPTYEDTLKKCQSLTRQHSAPPPLNRRDSPEQRKKVITHLPPSGLQIRTLGRSPKASSPYIQDRHHHFNNTSSCNGANFSPNRFSSGEYDNVSTTSSSRSSSELKDRLSTPPLSKRNGDTWKRT